MKNFFVFGLAIATVAVAISSCGSDEPSTPQTYTPTKVHFRGDGFAKYDLFKVDTPDASGNNPDRLIPNLTGVEESIVDTAVPFPNNVKAVKSVFSTTPPDTSFYYQDANGDLYRYNYGFSALNNYPLLLQYVGHPVDVGWVLIAKPGSPAGTTWVGKKDSVFVPAFFGWFQLQDQATTMDDTTFVVSNGKDTTLKAIHVRHNVTIHSAGNEILGSIFVDTYFSPDLGLTIEDFYHYSTITGALKQKNQGSLKIMKFYKP